MESSICTLCTISDFFWLVNCTNQGCKLSITCYKYQDAQKLFILDFI